MEMKNDYSKNYFWKIKNPKTQKYKFYLRPNGKLVEVNEDVFKVCYNSYKKLMRDNIKDNQARLISLDADIHNDVTYLDIVSDDKSMNIENQYKVSLILDEINKLNSDDKELITNLLIQEKTERELAKQLHVSQNAIHKRKNNILKKLRKKLNA
ncbi:MAG: sigma-70 family RNA polymerase sigma factor [Coprobacillus cateniformis]|nr:sigma-70 family RNA polymerase sigma factor [Coprobacillus cateniformis]